MTLKVAGIESPNLSMSVYVRSVDGQPSVMWHILSAGGPYTADTLTGAVRKAIDAMAVSDPKKAMIEAQKVLDNSAEPAPF